MSKLMSSDDIEEYLITIEQVWKPMKQERWAGKVAPHLTGKAHQAYASIGISHGDDYSS